MGNPFTTAAAERGQPHGYCFKCKAPLWIGDTVYTPVPPSTEKVFCLICIREGDYTTEQWLRIMGIDCEPMSVDEIEKLQAEMDREDAEVAVALNDPNSYMASCLVPYSIPIWKGGA